MYFYLYYYLGALILFFDFKTKNNKRALTIKTIIINKLKLLTCKCLNPNEKIIKLDINSASQNVVGPLKMFFI